MNFLPDTHLLADGIKDIYNRDNLNGEEAIEAFLLRKLHQINPKERLRIVAELIAYFEKKPHEPGKRFSETDQQFLHFCSLILGYPVEYSELGTDALQQRLTEALTTIFEALNQLTRAINLTLLEENQTQQTIRFLIGEQLDGGGDTKSLKKHLDQIKNAFVISHRAFKMAAQITIQKILDELSPDELINKDRKGLKFGPLRKAEAFDQYSETYNNFRLWFKSGRCMQEFFRTFEKQCHEISKQQRR